MTARFFLGMAEAGLFPGINYYLSCWYKRNEFGIRAAIFFSAAAVSGSFGGLLAAAIGKMSGVGGKGGWAWILYVSLFPYFPCATVLSIASSMLYASTACIFLSPKTLNQFVHGDADTVLEQHP